MLLKRRTGNGKINKRNKKTFGNEVADRISLRLGFFPCFFFFLVLFCFYFSIPRARSFHSNIPSLESLETLSIWFFMGNRKPQNAVCSYTFAVSRCRDFKF